MDFSSLNFLSIVVAAAAAAFVIGFLWHGPLFGKTWMRLMKIDPATLEREKQEMAKKMPMILALAFVQQLIVATVISMLAGALLVSNAAGALTLAFWLWLGFIATVQLNGVLWEKRTVNLYAFNIVYHFVVIAVITMIVTLW